MKDKVKEMVDRLFAGAADNEETKALRDELMDNCLEHYQDLVSGGMDEEAALEAVKDSLSGMQEIVDRYSGKPDKAVIPAPKEEEPAEEEPADMQTAWPADGISRVRVDSAGHSVTLSASEDGLVHVECDTPKAVRVTMEGDALIVEAVRVTEEAFSAAREAAAEPGEAGPKEAKSFLDMSLNEIFKKARQAVIGVMKTMEQHMNDGTLFNDAEFRIRVPRGLLSCLDISTAGGDVSVDHLSVKDTAVRTASGDIRVDLTEEEAVERLFLSSASGDITALGAGAREAQISAISGDVEIRGGFEAMRCKSVSGDVELTGTAGDLKAKSVSGDVTVSLLKADAGAVSAETTSGDVTVYLPEGGPAPVLNVNTVAGDVRNEAGAAESSPLRITVRTVSGDILVSRDNG